METQFAAESEPAVTSLLGGIVEDAKRLMVEQLTLFQVEIKNDLKSTVRAVIPLIAGAIVLLPACLLLGMSAAYGLCAAFPDLPLWAGFAIIGGSVLLIRSGLVLWGTLALNSVSLTPDTALKGLKENIQWKTKN